MNEQVYKQTMKNIEARLDAGLPIEGLSVSSRSPFMYISRILSLAAFLELKSAQDFTLLEAQALDEEISEEVAGGASLSHRHDILWKNLKERIKQG